MAYPKSEQWRSRQPDEPTADQISETPPESQTRSKTGRETTPDSKTEALFEVATSQASIVSRHHPDRNEDAILGDPDRVIWESAAPPRPDTIKPQTDADAIARAAEQEMDVANQLRDLGVIGLFDGISGEQHGSGLYASRMAAAETAKELAKLDPKATAEETRGKLVVALARANDVIKGDLSAKGRHDLFGQTGTTAAVARIVSGPDGRPRVPYAYCGNTRIYRYRPNADELAEVTIDHTAAGQALRHHLDPDRYPPPKTTDPKTKTAITRAEYEAINAPDGVPDTDEGLRELVAKNNTFTGTNRTIGLADFRGLQVEVGIVEAEPGDVIMIASDGAYSEFSKQALQDRLRQGLSADEICREAAGSAGPEDDASMIIVRLNQPEE